MVSVQEIVGKELCLSSHDPLMIQLHRMEDQLRDKERELGGAYSEIKALKASEALQDKAVLEISIEMKKLEEKLRITEKQLEHKNLEVKKLNDERKDALASQYAAEAALRRVHVSKEEDDEYFPVEAIIAPLESDIKKYKNEISSLREDKKALERITKSKEAALLEAQKILQSALERVLIVENVQSENCDLRRQVEICQDENKFLNKIYRQKVLEVEKLAQTIHDLEESLLVSGMAANNLQHYRRQVSDLSEEKRTLERELARAKVSLNRVATAVANERKDDNDKVMPVKLWLEERKYFQGKIQQLQEKLLSSERTSKAEAQFKEKLKLRLRTLEESLRQSLRFSSQHGGSRKQSLLKTSKSNSSCTTSIMQQTNIANGHTDADESINLANSMEVKYVIGENPERKNSYLESKNCNSKKEHSEGMESPSEQKEGTNIKTCILPNDESQVKQGSYNCEEDIVSGFLYDRLQKEFINLKKLLEAKDWLLSTRDEEIKVLHKKVGELTKSIEVELGKARNDAICGEKDQNVLNKGMRNKKLSRNEKHVKSTAIQETKDLVSDCLKFIPSEFLI